MKVSAIISEEKKVFHLPSKLESVEDAAAIADEFAKRAGFEADALFAIDLAVREAVANAIKHGNKLDETKQVEVILSNLKKGFEVRVRDFGVGFDVEAVPDPTNPENLLKANGRGILFMRNFMEEVNIERHKEGGMIVTMCKLR